MKKQQKQNMQLLIKEPLFVYARTGFKNYFLLFQSFRRTRTLKLSFLRFLRLNACLYIDECFKRHWGTYINNILNTTLSGNSLRKIVRQFVKRNCQLNWSLNGRVLQYLTRIWYLRFTFFSPRYLSLSCFELFNGTHTGSL